MANTYTKIPLSGSTDGRGILIATTSTPGTIIHTAQASASLTDEVWLWASNSNATGLILTIEFGGVTDPGDVSTVEVPESAGLTPIIPGLMIRNGLIVRAFAGTVNLVTIFGYVHRES